MTNTDELAEAKAAVESMTPEDYLELMTYVQKLEGNLPEAPASLSVKGVDSDGWALLMTMRDVDETLLMRRWFEYKKKVLGPGNIVPDAPFRPQIGQTENTGEKNTTTASASTEDIKAKITSPEEPNLDGADIEVFEVISLNHQVSQSGHHFLNVKGGKWIKFGWKAWPEVIPAGFELEQWEVGIEQPPPVDFQLAYIDREKKKVVAFARTVTKT